MPTEPPVGCIILAAGASRRLGQPKQLVPIDGQPMLARVTEAALATPGLWPVVVVLGAHKEVIRPSIVRLPVQIADNPAWAEGMASSLRIGLDTIAQFSRNIDAVLITLCDQPDLTTDTLTRLLQAHRQNACDVVAARYGGHIGAPAIVRRPLFAAMAHLTGDEGARQIFQHLPPAAIAAVDFPELVRDIDTPADLAT